MRILKIEIEEFGKLCDALFLFGDGLNLIEGPNESGKSTLLAFIRFALYGFPRKVGADGEEREKRLSWRTQRAAGRLVLRTGAGDFSIYRSVTRQGSAVRESFSERLSVTSLTSGEELALNGLSPGEYFLGLPAALYDSTLCLRQSDAARVSDPAVSDALNEMLFAGHDGVGADTAVEKLQRARRELQHQKGRGGRIADLEDCIAATQDNLLRAREDSGVLQALRVDVARYRTQVNERRKELEQVTAQLSDVAAHETLALFDRAHAAEELCAQKRAYWESLAAKNSAIGDLSHVVEEVQGAMREYESAKLESIQMLPELTRMRAVRHDEKLLSAHALLEQKGGAPQVLSDFRVTQSRQKRAKKTGLILLLVALAIGALTFLIASGTIVPVLMLFLPVGTYLGGVCVIGLAACVLLLLVSFGFFGHASRCRKRAAAWIKRLGVQDVKMFRTYLEQCNDEAQSAQAHQTLLSELESVWAERMGRVARAESAVRGMLFDAGLTVPEKMEEVPALLAECQSRYRAAQELLLAAQGDWERANAAREALERSLEGKDEHALRARLGRVDGYQPEQLQRKQAFLREALSGLEKKCAEAERREAALAATAKDTSVQESELAALRAEYKSAQRRLAALEMALAAMEEATRALSEGVAPQLCEHASAHFQALTGGTYRRIYVGSDLKISLDSDRGPLPISRFSAGCRDAAHLALRLGLLDTLSQEQLPLLFDEAFSRLDDERARALLQLLQAYCRDGGQCLLFTCHGREAEMLGAQDFTYFELQ